MRPPNIVRGEKDFIEKIPTAKVTLQSGDAQSPVLDFIATATNVAHGQHVREDLRCEERRSRTSPVCSSSSARFCRPTFN